MLARVIPGSRVPTDPSGVWGPGAKLGPAGRLRTAPLGTRESVRLAPGPSALPADDILPELLSSGIEPLVEEIHGRFTSSLVSAGGPCGQGPRTGGLRADDWECCLYGSKWLSRSVAPRPRLGPSQP